MSDVAEAPVVAPPAAPPLDKLVERYIQLRDRKAQMKKAYEESVAEIDTAMDRVEAYFLKHMNETGVDSFKTASGTPYKSEKTSATVSDKDLFRGFVNGRADGLDFVDLKANKTVVSTYMKEHNALPPGVNWSSVYTVNVRR